MARKTQRAPLICLRRPSPGLMVNSDRDSQYTSKAAYRRLLKAYSLIGA